MSRMHRLLTALRTEPSLGRYAGALVVRGGEVVGKLGLYILAARALGLHEAGLFFLCLTWIGLASTVARLGFDKAMTRHIASELAIGQGLAARRALLHGLGWTSFGGIAAAALTWAVAGPAARHIFTEPDLAAPLQLAALVIVPQTLALSVGAALAGFNRGIASQLVMNAIWPLLTLAALLAGVTSLAGVMAALGLALLASSLLGLVWIAGERPRLRDRPAPEGSAIVALPALWHTAMPLLAVESVQVALNSLPVLALGAFADAATVGAFSVANRISMLIWVVIISIGIIVSPSFAAHHRRGEWAALRKANRMARLAVAAASLPAILVMLLVPGWLLALVGSGFEVAAGALVILSLGQLVNGLLSCQDVMLAMTGHGALLRRLNLLQLAVGLVLGATLIPSLGMTGAAIVGAATLAQGAIGTTLAVRRLMPQAL